jgi:ATP-dependent Lon protease
MKESARAALSYVRSRAKKFGIDEKIFGKNDIHIHVPAGAIPKDGPSAGVAMVTSLVSSLLRKTTSNNTAMTGEITLRGKVLPVGGIKEKVLAAKRAGISRVILPARNKKDLEDVPENARKELEFVFVDNVEQVLNLVLLNGRHRPRKTKSE